MKPYYEHAGITIYHGDCREVLGCLPVAFCGTCRCELVDEMVLAIHATGGHDVGPYCDLLLSDPPYGIGLDTGYSGLPNGRGGRDYARIIGDKEPFDPSHLLSFERIILWGGHNYASALPKNNGWLVWDKRYGHDPDAFFGDCELAWTNLAGGVRICRIPYASSQERNAEGILHPTQKPVALMHWCIRRAAWHGTGPAKTKEFKGVVLDPYCGSGPTLMAAKKLGKSAIGIEIEEKYCEIAAKRLSQEVFQFEEKPQ